MSNTLTSVIPTIFAQGLMALREQAVMARLVNTDFSREVSQQGNSVDVPIPSAITAQSVTAANTPPSTADIAPTSASIALSQWKEAPFQLSDKEMAEAVQGVVPSQVTEAIRSLANVVDSYVLGFYTKIYGYQGTAGTTPFAAVGDATGARKILSNQIAPLDERRMVVDPDAEAAALALGAFLDASASGDANVVINGNIGRKLGFDWFMDQNIPTHTLGAAGTWLVDQTDVATGDTGIHCDGATTTASVGDVFTVAGDTQTYTIVTSGALSTTDVDITFQPAAKVAWANNAAITWKATHVVNLAFNKDCFALATRPLAPAPEGTGVITMSEVDPVSGLTLRLEITREYKRTRWAFDILYGAQCVRPELGCRVAG